MNISQPDVHMELDHSELKAETAVEFRQLLDRVRQAAGLTCGQIAAKTTIPRSQAYSLVSKSRTTLPSRPEQVRKFIEACKLNPMQADIVMGLWSRLNELDEPTLSLAPTHVDQAEPAKVPTERLEPPSRVFLRRRQVLGPGLLDLAHFVIADEDRTRRALKLLYPFVGAFIAIVALLVIWAILFPEIGRYISAGFFALAMLTVGAAVTRNTRRRRGQKRL